MEAIGLPREFTDYMPIFFDKKGKAKGYMDANTLKPLRFDTMQEAQQYLDKRKEKDVCVAKEEKKITIYK